MVQYTKRKKSLQNMFKKIELMMSFIIFLFVMIQLYPNQECHIYVHCTFIEIPMFINLNNYLTQKIK